MNKLQTLLDEVNLPIQLKGYFVNSKSTSKYLTEEMLYVIEDLFIFFNSLYVIDTSEFSSAIIKAVRNTKNSNSLYEKFKIMIETEIKLTSKDTHTQHSITSSKIEIEGIFLFQVFLDTAKSFEDYIDRISKKETVNPELIYKSLGKIDFITSITKDLYFEELRKLGEELIMSDSVKERRNYL